MSAPIHVHALMYTATCGEILEPVIRRLGRDERFSVTATARMATAATSYWNLWIADTCAVAGDASLLQQFLRTPGPRLLLLVADWKHPAHQFGADAVRAARKAGIPTMSLQHGIFSVFKETGEIAAWDFTADVMGVWGPAFRDLLVETGKATEDRIAVTGSPRCAEFGALGRPAARKLLGLAETAKAGLVAISTHDLVPREPTIDGWSEALVRTMVADIMSGMEAAGFDHIIVRPHPAELFWSKTDIYVDAAREAGVRVGYSNVHRVSQPGLFDVISAMDAVVTRASTVGLYGAVTGVPSLAMDFTDVASPLCNWIPDGVAFRKLSTTTGTLRADLADALRSLPDGETLRAASQSLTHSTFLEGDSVGRILNVAEDLVRRAG